MNEQDLPRHILEKMERRWASRIARDAAAWQSEKPNKRDGGHATGTPALTTPSR